MGMLIEYRYNEGIRGFNQRLLAVRKPKATGHRLPWPHNADHPQHKQPPDVTSMCEVAKRMARILAWLAMGIQTRITVSVYNPRSFHL